MPATLLFPFLTGPLQRHSQKGGNLLGQGIGLAA